MKSHRKIEHCFLYHLEIVQISSENEIQKYFRAKKEHFSWLPMNNLYISDLSIDLIHTLNNFYWRGMGELKYSIFLKKYGEKIIV